MIVTLRCKRLLLDSRGVLLGRGGTFHCLESSGKSLDLALEMGAWEPSLLFFCLLSGHEISNLSHHAT